MNGENLSHDERAVLDWFRKAKVKTRDVENGGHKMVSVLLVGPFDPLASVSHQMDFIAGVTSLKHAEVIAMGEGFVVEDNLLSP